MKGRRTSRKQKQDLNQVVDQFKEAGKGLGQFLKTTARTKLSQAESDLRGEVDKIAPPVIEKIRDGRRKLVNLGLKSAKGLGSLARSAEEYLDRNAPTGTEKKKEV